MVSGIWESFLYAIFILLDQASIKIQGGKGERRIATEITAAEKENETRHADYSVVYFCELCNPMKWMYNVGMYLCPNECCREEKRVAAWVECCGIFFKLNSPRYSESNTFLKVDSSFSRSGRRGEEGTGTRE